MYSLGFKPVLGATEPRVLPTVPAGSVTGFKFQQKLENVLRVSDSNPYLLHRTSLS